MSTTSEIIFGLLSFGLLLCIVWQQVFFMLQIQKLVDKVMSRSFQEYKIAERPREVKAEVQNEIPDDLRVLQGING